MVLVTQPKERVSSEGSEYQQSGKHVVQETKQRGGNDFFTIMEKELESTWLAMVEEQRVRERLVSVV